MADAVKNETGVRVGSVFSLTKTEQMALGPLLNQQAQVQQALTEVGNELQKRLGLPEGCQVKFEGDKVILTALPPEKPKIEKPPKSKP